jgi:hypothetical protein
MREPLAQPGKVVRRLRGTVEEQIAALPDEAALAPASLPARRKQRASQPKPLRTHVIKAEQALDAIRQRQARERDELARRQAELERERTGQKDRHSSELATAEEELSTARDCYEQALRKWQG